jgi:predicted ATPase with chaperone activity
VAFAATLCRAQLGLQAPLVHVEVNTASRLSSLRSGLAATAVRESRERVRAAS